VTTALNRNQSKPTSSTVCRQSRKSPQPSKNLQPPPQRISQSLSIIFMWELFEACTNHFLRWLKVTLYFMLVMRVGLCTISNKSRESIIESFVSSLRSLIGFVDGEGAYACILCFKFDSYSKDFLFTKSEISYRCSWAKYRSFIGHSKLNWAYLKRFKNIGSIRETF